MSCVLEKTEVVQVDSNPQQLDLPEGVPPLGSLYLYASGGCNLACKHCWITPSFDPSGKNVQHIKLEYVEKAINEGKPLGLHSIKLTGGEPLLHPRFRELVSLVDDAGLNITIETNGTLVDIDLARFLRQKSHVSHISVSVDGSTPEVHDDLRGVEGSFNWAVDGIKNLVEVGFRPQLICTLHKGNVTQIEEVIVLAESLGCGSVKFNHVQVVGRGDRYAQDHGLEIGELIEIHQRIEKTLRPRSRIRIFYDIPLAFCSIRQLAKDSLGRCGVHSILGMLAGGELALCGIGVTVPDLIYGHIENGSLREVWCDSPGLSLLREQIPDQLEGICAQCIHRHICLGSCVANNYHVAGKLNAPYIFCDVAEKRGFFPRTRKR